MTIAAFVHAHYFAKERALCLGLFKERVFRTLQDAHEAMDRTVPAGYVEQQTGIARSMVASGSFWLSRGCMNEVDLADLEFYQELVRLMDSAVQHPYI